MCNIVHRSGPFPRFSAPPSQGIRHSRKKPQVRGLGAAGLPCVWGREAKGRLPCCFRLDSHPVAKSAEVCRCPPGFPPSRPSNGPHLALKAPAEVPETLFTYALRGFLQPDARCIAPLGLLLSQHRSCWQSEGKGTYSSRLSGRNRKSRTFILNMPCSS